MISVLKSFNYKTLALDTSPTAIRLSVGQGIVTRSAFRKEKGNKGHIKDRGIYTMEYTQRLNCTSEERKDVSADTGLPETCANAPVGLCVVFTFI